MINLLHSIQVNIMHVSREDARTQIYLDGMILQWVKNARHLENIITLQLKDDMDIQLKCGQFYGAVNSLCAKFRV